MDRTINVRGTGKLSVAPDTAEVSLTLRSRDKNYSAAMEASSAQQAAVRGALEQLGFARDDLKTTSFNVHTEYDSQRDPSGVFRQVFAGFNCEHMMMLRFPFDNARLTEVLTALCGCLAEPELYISFTVKDKEALSDALLADAAKNARKRAEVLAEASGVSLGRLISIDYSLADHAFVSPTRFTANAKMRAAAVEMDVAPEDVSVTEDVNFVWEIC